MIVAELKGILGIEVGGGAGGLGLCLCTRVRDDSRLWCQRVVAMGWLAAFQCRF